jgi:basic amino acid/polyamine antiporter, APA family
VLGLWPFYCLGVAAVFVLRKSRPDLPRPYRVWGYPVVPSICLLAAVGMLVGALVTDPVNTGITFALLAAGIPLYYLTAGRRLQQQRVGPSA